MTIRLSVNTTPPPLSKNLNTMPCTQEYIDFVCAQLEGLGAIRAKKMFGDWCIYIDEKCAILACDGLCYVKMIPEIADMMQGAWTGYPYEGAKEHYILDIEHRTEARKVVKKLVEVLPYPKPRKKKLTSSQS